MNNIDKFNETVGILVKAYLNDTLEHGNYCGCAVGNLMAHHVGARIIKTSGNNGRCIAWDHSTYEGGEWFYTTPNTHERNVAMELVRSTGYSFREIMAIERAFEIAPLLGDRMFNGLMAVVDVLAEIHGIDLEQKESAKLMFVK